MWGDVLCLRMWGGGSYFMAVTCDACVCVCVRELDNGTLPLLCSSVVSTPFQ